MPLPLIPLVLGAASLYAGAKGIKKGLEAKEDLEMAKDIAESAQRRHRRAVEKFEKLHKETSSALEALGKKKAEIFKETGQALVDIVEQARAQAELRHFELTDLPSDLIPTIRKDLGQLSALELSAGAGQGLAMAALGASGIYGAVGALGTASTGTAIASLSGAAATNATLAWLGGGSLAAGGLGMAGGSWVLAGVLAGPALAIAGYTLASKAEEAYTEARAYKAEVQQKIEEINLLKEFLNAVGENVRETEEVLDRLHQTFEEVKAQYLALAAEENADASQQQKQDALLHHLIAIFKAIKEVVQTALVEQEGKAVTGLKERYTEVLQVANITVPALPAPGD